MGNFINNVVSDIARKQVEDLADLEIIFSNRRVIKYFNKFYEQEIKQTLWKPCCKSISDFIDESSDLKQADEFCLIYQLFLSYNEIYYKKYPLITEEIDNSFESFYNWGKIILSDFDDIDKNLVDAEKLFKLIEDNKKFEEVIDFLNDEQKELLSEFFNIFTEHSDLKENFIKIWNCLYEIYCLFKEKLNEQKIAYSGMIYRNFLDNLKNGNLKFRNENFAIVGFNVLNKCEREIFSYLKENYKVDFYWDYDEYYTKSDIQEAGVFMKENLSYFPHNKTFAESNSFNNIETNKNEINIIETNYENECAYYIKTWIKDLENKYGKDLKQNEISIILGNENLLPFVLKHLPKTICETQTTVNIAMGYPLSSSVLFNEIEEKINSIQTTDKSVLSQLDELREFINNKGCQDNQNKEIKQICYSIIKMIDDFKQTIEFNKIENLQNSFLKKTILFLLRRLHIPFESDAINGLQIMGLLESRNLNFKHVLVLSASDDNIPKVNNNNSFIPLSIKEAFGLTDQKKKVAVFAYYFYRLLHDRTDLDFVYSTIGSSGKIKEMSRFLYQLKLESNIKFNDKHINISIPSFFELDFDGELKDERLKRKEEDIEKIKKYEISASMINTYLSCNLRFFFKYVKRLKPIEDVDISFLAFGNLFHKSAEYLLKNGKGIDYQKCVKEGLKSLKEEEQEIITKSEETICKKYLEKLDTFYNNSEHTFTEAERKVIKTINVDNIGEIKLQGIIDRLDVDKEGNLVVIDYKTSKKNSTAQSLENKFKNERNLESLFEDNTSIKSYFLQIIYYAYLLWEKEDGFIDTHLVYPHLLNEKTKNDCSVLRYTYSIHRTFEELLKNCLESMFSKEDYWRSTENKKNCNYCDYKEICDNLI